MIVKPEPSPSSWLSFWISITPQHQETWKILCRNTVRGAIWRLLFWSAGDTNISKILPGSAVLTVSSIRLSQCFDLSARCLSCKLFIVSMYEHLNEVFSIEKLLVVRPTFEVCDALELPHWTSSDLIVGLRYLTSEVHLFPPKLYNFQ